MTLRLVEDPLGDDAAERPSREAVEAMWEGALQLPVPDYPAEAQRRFRLPARPARG